MRCLRSIAFSWAAVVAVSGCTSVVDLAWQDAGGAASDAQQAGGAASDSSSASLNQGGTPALSSSIAPGTEPQSTGGTAGTAATTPTAGAGGTSGASSNSERGAAGAGSVDSKTDIPLVVGVGR
jgi:hypothetical protein